MPFSYGGGISTVEHVGQLIKVGVEKVVINSAALHRPELISEAADLAGRSSIVVSIDVRRSVFGRYEVVSGGGTQRTGRDPVEWATQVADLGAGEILITAVDREGTMSGYDLDLVKAVSTAVSIPVIASGGAGTLTDFRKAVDAGAAAVCAGSFFVFHGKHRAVLITYPNYRELQALFRT
jgi:cyclase